MKTLTITCIIIIIVNIIYTNIEPAIVLNEIYNSILQQNKNTNAIYKIANSITDMDIHILQNNNVHSYIFNTDNISINNNVHLKNIYITILSIFCITIVHILNIKIKAALYIHEIDKIKQIVYTITISILIVVLYYTEITTNMLIKKNFNSTEILNTTITNFSIKDYIIGIIIVLVYYIVIQNKNFKKETLKNKIQTKYVIWIMYIVFINIYAQYSINESILIIIYTESIYQIINAYKSISMRYNK